MNRFLVALVLVVSGCAFAAAAAAEGARGGTAGVTQLILIFFSDVSRGLVPKRVVAEDKEWKVVKEAEQERDARKSEEERRREAYKHLEEREREARMAHEEYRRETRTMLQTRQYAWQRRADEPAQSAQEAQ